MKIDKEKCIGCDLCHPYCPVGAITTVEWEGGPVSEINQVECVECGTCHERSGICAVDAIYRPELKWPRIIRESFSNSNASHTSTKTQGRGTEEMKTNDVTGRYDFGVCGVALEFGRPGISTSFRDIEQVAKALANVGVKFEVNNPLTALMANTETGIFKKDILDERVLSAILEFMIKNERLVEILLVIKDVSSNIDTVFSLDLISRVEADGNIPVISIAQSAGFFSSKNCKTNLGLGRPLVEEA